MKRTDAYKLIFVLLAWLASGAYTIHAVAQAIRHHGDSTFIRIDSLKINDRVDPAVIRKFVQQARAVAVANGMDTSKLFLEGFTFGNTYGITSPQPGNGKTYWVYVTGYGEDSRPTAIPIFIPDSIPNRDTVPYKLKIVEGKSPRFEGLARFELVPIIVTDSTGEVARLDSTGRWIIRDSVATLRVVLDVLKTKYYPPKLNRK
jgi:hypothetical protein